MAVQIFNSGDLILTDETVVIQGRREAPLWQGALSGCLVLIALIGAIISIIFISELPGLDGLLNDPKQLAGAIGLMTMLALPVLLVVAFVAYSERPAIIPRRGILTVRQQEKTLALLALTARGHRPGWYAFAVSSNERAAALAARLREPHDARYGEEKLIAIPRRERAAVLRRRELREAFKQATERLASMPVQVVPQVGDLRSRRKLTALPGHGLLLTGPNGIMLIGHPFRPAPWWLPFAMALVVLALMPLLASWESGPPLKHVLLILAAAFTYNHLRIHLSAPPALPRGLIWNIRVEGRQVSLYGTPRIGEKARWYTFIARCEEEARGIERNLRVRKQGRQRRYPVVFEGK